MLLGELDQAGGEHHPDLRRIGAGPDQQPRTGNRRERHRDLELGIVAPAGALEGVLPAPVNEALERYRAHYEADFPADARYLENHRGHLMFIRDDERELMIPELITQMTMTGTQDEILGRLRALQNAGYTQFVVQLVEHHEDALEQWAEVFAAL